MKLFNIKVSALATTLKNMAKLGLLPLVLGLSSTTSAHAVSLEIFAPLVDNGVSDNSEIYGSSKTITGSGNSFNYGSNVELGDSARFRVREKGETTDFAQLEIVYSGDNGVTNNNINDHKVMIAQTESSQGFTDTGTISIYIDLDTSGGNGGFTFNWYEPNGTNVSTVAKDLQVLYTAYDIDFGQEVSFDTSEAQSITLNGDTSKLDYTIGTETSIFDTTGVGSEFTDPNFAAQILSRNDASDTFYLGKTTGSGPALYVLEFRDPSNLTFPNASTVLVPFEFSPGLGVILGSSLFGFLRLRKKFG